MNTPPLSQQLQPAREHLAAQRPASEADAAVLIRLTRLQQAQQAQQAQPVPVSQPARWPVAQGAQAPGARAGLPRLATGGAWLAGALLVLATALLTIEPPRLDVAPEVPALADSGFMPVVSQDEWRRALASDGQAPVWLMPTELPRERLALLGLPYDATRAEQRVKAELMLHPSGQLLAVRFVQ